MAAAEAAQKIRVAMDQLKATGVRERPLVEVLDLSHQMADAMTAFFGSLDKSIIGEFNTSPTSSRRHATKSRASRPTTSRTPGSRALRLNSTPSSATPSAQPSSIMTEAEKLMGVEPTDLATYKAEVDAAMMRIFEACSFQDLTGQRVTKVIATLRHIEERVTKFAGALGVTDTVKKETAEEARRANFSSVAPR